MLRKTLLVTTALVLGASVAYSKGVMPKNSKLQAKLISHAAHVVNGAPVIVRPDHRGIQPTHNVVPHLESSKFSNYSKNANGQYVSWYGFTAANESSCYSYSIYHSCFNFVGDNALSFTSGVTAPTKKVTVPMFSYFPSAQYEVNIYSDAGGLPGSVLATSHTFSDSDTSLCCTSSRTVAIHANLTAGQTYFIGLVGTLNNGNSYGGWNMEDVDFSGASVDYWHYNEVIRYSSGTGYHTYSYGSPWHASTYIPSTGAVVLK
jgi:hypothetical protein